MNNSTQQLHIKSAVTDHSRFNLDESLLTSLDFGQLIPFYTRQVVIGDKFNFKGSFFARTAPLVFPAYVSSHLTTVCAYVPYHQLFDNAEAFFSNSSMYMSHDVNIPTIGFKTIDELFCMPTLGSYVASDSFYHYTYVNSEQERKYIRFTYKGKLFYKILVGLGYNIHANVNFKTGSSYDTKAGESFGFSALPLLAFCKVYVDWFMNNKYVNNTIAASILLDVKRGVITTLSKDNIYNLLDSIKLLYDTDFITTAWQSPNRPLNDVYSTPKQSQFTMPGLSPAASSFNSVTTTEFASQILKTPITAVGIKALQSLDKYIRRNNYAGSKAAIRALSRFGIKTDDFKSNYSDILSVSRQPLNIGDVTQTSDETTSPLGSYAGKAILSGDCSCNASFDDFGQFLVLGFISVKTPYPFTFDKEVLKTQPLDFYNPEFDGIGTQALSYDEIYTKPTNYHAQIDGFYGTNTFGFTERYYEYKQPKNRINGDMLFDDTFKCWHTARDLSPIYNNQYGALTEDLIYYSNEQQSDLCRIFAMRDDEATDTSYDHFFISAYFNLSALRPMKNLSQSTELGEGSINLNKDGNVIS
ncbi:major capsid protein [Capybara microvirus Cap1_SP_22]|nr:major capsid protein [Capybara microvirus Cap1_SP_22]